MRPRPILIYGATLIAAASLVLAGREVALRFTEKATFLDIVAPFLAVATALICIGVLDWARNLHRLSRRYSEGGEVQELAVVPAPAIATSQAEERLIGAVHDLERIANEEFGLQKTLEEAVKALADFSRASRVTLWMADDEGTPRPQAQYNEGEMAVGDAIAVEPSDEEALREVFEHHRPLEADEGDGARFLLPLVSGQECFGVLKAVVPTLGPGGRGGDAAQKLSSDLSELSRHFARAVRAPDLYDRAVIDPLTGLYSKRHFINRLTEATGLSRRYGEPLSLVVMDVDNFKIINSTYGAATGDRALRSLAALVHENIREVDSAFRYGADEIAVIIPDTEIDQANTFAERLRRVIRAHRALADDGGQVILTVSIGIAEFDEDMRGIGQLIACAEEALYAAKQRGHDRVERWHEPTQPKADEAAS